MSYEWFTDPAGNRHFYRVKAKASAPKKAAVVVAVADIDDLAAEAVLTEPVAPKPAPRRRAPAKKKSNG